MQIHQIISKLDRMKLADGNRLLEQIIATEEAAVSAKERA
jgi:hypothetical protein